MEQQERILDISWGSIAKISIAALGLYLLFLIRDLLVWFLFALIIALVFDPAIDFLQKWRVPRVVAAILTYFGAFGFLGFVIYLVVPVFVVEIFEFSQLFPQYFEKISPPLTGLGIEAFQNIEGFVGVLGDTLSQMATSIFSSLFSIFGGIATTIFILTIAIFLSAEEKFVERGLLLVFPKKYEAIALTIWNNAQKKVAGWFAVKILGVVFIGVVSYIAFLLLNIEYPFTLALMAGILDFIPVVGPIIAGLIIFAMVSLDSFLKAIFVLLFFVLLQQIEGNILTPVLTQRFIGLPPVLVLMSLVIGGTLFGLLGAILFVPLAGILFEFLRDFLKKKKEAEAAIL